ncbi:MAG: SAM-dependent methyltransferase [Myxococcota bacterium]
MRSRPVAEDPLATVAAMPAPFWVYEAVAGFASELQAELGDCARPLGAGLWLAPPADPAWAADVWRDPEVQAIASITDAARALRARGRHWHLHPVAAVRRSRLIEEKLARRSAKPWTFPRARPTTPMGAFTLLDAGHVLLAAETRSPFPGGAVRFLEDRDGPPSRAYLKLWEALTLMGGPPTADARCLDLGSAPGGWTWVLSQHAGTVVSVDKALLAPEVSARPNVVSRRESAFALEPRTEGRFDWLCSDVICYPSRLLRLVERWIAADAADRFVCTLKFQGRTDHETAAAFAAIPGATVRHLHHNKHELTFMLDRTGAD